MRRRIRLSESSLHRIIKESVRRVLREAKKTKYWEPDEFITYDDAASYLCTGDARYKNMERYDRLGVPEDERCPFCSKQLKQGSYKTLTYNDPDNNGNTHYYFHPEAPGKPMKIGNGCFKRLSDAYKGKYGK